MPIVSVIVAVYNVEKHLDRCLKSIVSQSFSDIEILLMVGLCTDNSLQKCIEWQKKDPRIVIVSRKDEGLGDARNYALAIAKGDFVAYVDADDYIAPNYIEYLATPLINDTSIDISCCGYHDINKEGNVLHTFLPRLTGKTQSNFPFFLKHLLSPQVWLRMYRTDWLKAKNIYMYNGSGEDVMFSYLLAAQATSIYFVPQALYYYYIENESSLMHSPQTYYSYPKAYAAAIDYLLQHNKYLEVREYLKEDILSLFRYLLSKTAYDTLLLNSYNDFITNYFPEVKRFSNPLDSRHTAAELLQQPIVLFGAGIAAKRLIDEIDESKILYIVDNDPKLHHTKLQDIPILPLQTLAEERAKITVVVSSIRFFYNISQQLEQLGITNYISGEDYLLLHKQIN